MNRKYPLRSLTTKRNLSLYSAAPPLASHHQTQPLSLCSAAPPLSSRDRQGKKDLVAVDTTDYENEENKGGSEHSSSDLDSDEERKRYG
ncbi:hypothetical protein P8452_03228 [Trifolium repens]|nr:hypothetical protein P8452_03228 [Trifolium repens]